MCSVVGAVFGKRATAAGGRSEPVKARGDSQEEEEERRQDGRRMDWRGIEMEEYCR